ncbi:MAG: M1 family metallopeptidase [Gemmatimonadetes bacterium]|nr:M1 family metallopeptidase [Gemmatimonadota bacterium]
MTSILTALALLQGARLASGEYFQQRVAYRIEASLDEATHVLRGRARLRYLNQAPAELDTLFFHLHLNAFRPNSAWALRELQFGESRFQRLGPADHAFERLLGVRVRGVEVRPVYPGAPDSTVVAVPLPVPLAPGDSLIVDLDWAVRLSIVPRRQGRRGRHYDFAQWYPRIAVYDAGGWRHHPLLPQGEFYGEFGSYDVTLDLSADQVLGATGEVVAGDPGWRPALPRPAGTAAAARSAEALGLLAAATAPGRKQLRWRADSVHHFAWSTAPDYVYEGGAWNGVAIHVLYQPGDTAWHRGAAVERTARALAWLDTIFGPYPYPQVTNVHRLEPGGTEFPMLVMNGSASQGLIVHEVAHIFAHGILANNEWLEAWLDEGLVSFLSNWFWERRGQPDIWVRELERAAERERAGATQPVATPAAEFADFAMYQAMTYTKASLIFLMLRGYLGEPVLRQVLRAYYERHRFRHVTERELRAVAEEVSGQELDWFFQQWLHTTATLDYAIGAAATERLPDGAWRTRVEVLRSGDAWMPVLLRVGDQVRRLESRAPRQLIEVTTTRQPAEAVLDPRRTLLELDYSNNRRAL